MNPIAIGVSLGLMAAAAGALWYGYKLGMYPAGPDLSNTRWQLDIEEIQNLNMSFQRAVPGQDLLMTWGHNPLRGTYKGSLLEFAVVTSNSTLKFAGYVNSAGTSIEGVVTPTTDASKAKHFVARRNNAVAYDKPKFLLHVKAVFDEGYRGGVKSMQEQPGWITNMYFAGNWELTTHAPDANQQITLKWGSVIPVRCLVDQSYGPFAGSNELCPTVKQVGAKLKPELANELGCPR